MGGFFGFSPYSTVSFPFSSVFSLLDPPYDGDEVEKMGVGVYKLRTGC